MFRTDAGPDPRSLLRVRATQSHRQALQSKCCVLEHRPAIAGGMQDGRDKINTRRSDETGNEDIVRILIEFHRRADLFDPAGPQHHNAAGERHRLDLIVRDVDHRRFQFLVQPGDLEPHLYAQFGVEIG
jgi:hypothetical protein